MYEMPELASRHRSVGTNMRQFAGLINSITQLFVSHLFSEEFITADLQMSTLTRTREDAYASRCYALPITSNTGLRS